VVPDYSGLPPVQTTGAAGSGCWQGARLGHRTHLLLVLEAPLGDDDVLDAVAVAVLLLERHEAPVELRRLRLGDVVQRVLVNHARALHLVAHLLELRKLRRTPHTHTHRVSRERELVA
jgi:hypothetical protein